MPLVDCSTLHHHIVVQRRHIGSNFLFVEQALLEETFVNLLDEAAIFVVQLGDKCVGHRMVNLCLSIDNLLQDVRQVGLHQGLDVTSIHFLNIFNSRKEAIIWHSVEDLAQIALASDKVQVLLCSLLFLS